MESWKKKLLGSVVGPVAGISAVLAWKIFVSHRSPDWGTLKYMLVALLVAWLFLGWWYWYTSRRPRDSN